MVCEEHIRYFCSQEFTATPLAGYFFTSSSLDCALDLIFAAEPLLSSESFDRESGFFKTTILVSFKIPEPPMDGFASSQGEARQSL